VKRSVSLASSRAVVGARGADVPTARTSLLSLLRFDILKANPMIHRRRRTPEMIHPTRLLVWGGLDEGGLLDWLPFSRKASVVTPVSSSVARFWRKESAAVLDMFDGCVLGSGAGKQLSSGQCLITRSKSCEQYDYIRSLNNAWVL